MAFHLGKPVEFLYLLQSHGAGGETWLTRALFVENQPDEPVLFHIGDRLTPLHTQRH